MALRYAPPGLRRPVLRDERAPALRSARPLLRAALPRAARATSSSAINPDAIISVHPLLNHAALRARADAHMQHVPVVTVITDLGKSARVVADARSRRRGRSRARSLRARAFARRLAQSRLRLLGHPIHPKFDDVTGTTSELRRQLGLPADGLVVMLMAGGEGGGKLLSTTLSARAGTSTGSLASSFAVATNTLTQKLDGDGADAADADDKCSDSPTRFPNISAPSICSSPKPGPGLARRSKCGAVARRGVRLRPGPRARQRRFCSHNGLGAVAIHGAAEVVQRR